MDTNPCTRAPLLIFDEFLVASELNGLLDFTLSRGDDFTATQVVNGKGGHHVDAGYRRSRVLYELDWYRDLFVNRILTFLPHVYQRLAHPQFPVAKVETQLTATNNGEFFRRHNDNGASSVKGRTITFVYFFHREPLPFHGGELRVYNTRSNDEVDDAGYTTIQPQQNQIVFFVSNYIHEILPVACGGDFADSRFTVNGWLHR